MANLCLSLKLEKNQQYSPVISKDQILRISTSSGAYKNSTSDISFNELKSNYNNGSTTLIINTYLCEPVDEEIREALGLPPKYTRVCFYGAFNRV